jgi:hypothetical protein
MEAPQDAIAILLLLLLYFVVVFFFFWFRKGLNPKGSPIGEARKTLEEERVADGVNALWILPRAAKA